MPPIVIVAIVALGLSLPLFAWALPGPGPVHRRTQTNLRRGLKAVGPDQPGAAAASRAGVGVLAGRLQPASTTRRLDRLLLRAGRPSGWTLDRMLTAKLALPVVAVLLGLVYLRSSPGLPATLVVGVVTVVAHFLPELLLHSRGQERSQKISVELADLLDQLSISVEAGLGFDAAMARAGRSRKGPLAEEVMRTMQDMQVGQSRRQAYEGLAERAAVPDLSRFVRSVIQADSYGIPLADVLRTQAVDARLKRRQRAEEKAMEIPTKVVFPLMLCILPVLFIVLLGPAAIDIMRVFS